MRILFWNTHKNTNINLTLSELIIENNISFVILAEYKANIDELIKILSLSNLKMSKYANPGCEHIMLLGNIKNVEFGQQSDHASIQIINNKIILCCVHLNSQIYSQNKEFREILVGQIMNDIQQTEKILNIDKTLVVGDFNMNPFDSTCVSAQFFHSIPIFEESMRKTRTVAGKEFSMFYNPMWNFLGDSKQPYGTYYYNGSDPINTFWNIYDQVILRPALKEQFIDESLKIITETKTKFLLDAKGHPDKDISDHLPIIFEIKED